MTSAYQCSRRVATKSVESSLAFMKHQTCMSMKCVERAHLHKLQIGHGNCMVFSQPFMCSIILTNNANQPAGEVPVHIIYVVQQSFPKSPNVCVTLPTNAFVKFIFLSPSLFAISLYPLISHTGTFSSHFSLNATTCKSNIHTIIYMPLPILLYIAP